jgi:hypothetical protein
MMLEMQLCMVHMVEALQKGDGKARDSWSASYRSVRRKGNERGREGKGREEKGRDNFAFKCSFVLGGPSL